MKLSDGKCHFCKNDLENIQHLFFGCYKIKGIVHEIEVLFLKLGMDDGFRISEEHMILGLNGNFVLKHIFNTVIFITKWIVWKLRNNVKYDHIVLRDHMYTKMRRA